MTGRLQVCEAQAEIAKHTHAILKLASGRELRFVDPRRFGRLSVAPAGDFDATGIEPLEVDLDRFLTLFRGRKTPIKSALLNQKLLRGVGNIYADESLFRAGLRPRRRAATIPREQLSGLFLAVKEVLNEAIALGGSSVSDYVNADGEEGFFQLQHRVYGREARGLSRVPDFDQAGRDCRTQQPLLPNVPEVRQLLIVDCLLSEELPETQRSGFSINNLQSSINNDFLLPFCPCLIFRSESISAGPTSALPPSAPKASFWRKLRSG